MIRISPVIGAAVVLCALMAPPLARAEDRPAAVILAEIGAALPERPADLNDQAALRDYKARADRGAKRRAELIGELYASHPETPELAELLPLRWGYQTGSPAVNVAIRDEIKGVIAKSKDEKILASAYCGLAMLALREGGPEPSIETAMAAVEEFCKRYPKDERGGLLLMAIASQEERLGEKERLLDRVSKEYPSPKLARAVGAARGRLERARRQLESVGKPFRLEFVDAIKGTPVSMEKLKGKVVVIDFWATWCGPCIAEIPNMKKLYAEYKDKGVEFIGVSLDQPVEKGGLDKLKDYVAKNGIEWPQYYQGNYWDSEFSKSWGIDSIPRVFLIDAEGNVASVEARGQLEKLIPESLEKSRSKTPH